MAFDRNALRSGLGNAAQQSAARAEQGPGFKNYILPTCPRPVWRKIAEGRHIISIVPFIPTADFGSCKKGEPAYVMEVFAHMNVGPTNESVICPAATLGKPCPICEDLRVRQEEGEDIKEKMYKRRVVYNVWRHDLPTREAENKGVHILEMAHFSMEMNILAIARHPVTNEWVPYADPDNGMDLCFTRKGTGMKNTKYEGFQWVDRQPLPDAILQEAAPLNEIIQVYSYKELADLWFVDEQQPESGPAGRGSAPTQQGAGQSKYGQTASSYATPAAPPQQEAPSNVPSNFYDQQEENTTPQQPPVQQPPVQQPPVQQPPVQQPPVQQPPVQQAPPTKPTLATAPAQRAAPQQGPECPMAGTGGVFGVSLDKLPQCPTCTLWDACAEAFDNSAQG